MAVLIQGSTVGHKRLLRFPEVTSRGVRILIEASLAPPALSRVGVFRASPKEGTLLSGSQPQAVVDP